VGKKILAAAAVIINERDEVLLIRRGHEPAKGKWSLPGGSVQPSETPAQAALREVREETGLEVELVAELWRISVALSQQHEFDLVGFSANYRGGDPVAGDDAELARWVKAAEFESLETTPRLAELLAAAGWPEVSKNDGYE
jgi:acetyl-CoA carboxylase carboxyl transferase subunit beta